MSIDLVQLVRLQFDIQIKVTGTPTTHALPALARDAQALTIGCALGNAHLDRPSDAAHGVVLPYLGGRDKNFDFDTSDHVLQPHLNAGFEVLTRHAELRVATSTTCPTTVETRQQIEQVDVSEVLKALRARLPTEAVPPVGRRSEILPRLVGTHLVVRGTLLHVFQDLVGFTYLLELLLGVLLLGDVRMVFAGQLAIRLLDVLFGRAAFDTQNGVVIFLFHAGPSVLDGAK